MANPHPHALYQVAVKILLRRDNRYLFMIDTNKKLDIPGGRLTDKEDTVPLMTVLDREVREEIGIDVRYRVVGPRLQYRRFFCEGNLKIMLVAYEAEYMGGDLKLSDEHESFSWLTPEEIDWNPELFYSEEEREALKTFFFP